MAPRTMHPAPGSALKASPASEGGAPRKAVLEAELLTPTELCARLKIGRRTYTRLLSQGRLPCVLVGTRKRFVWAQVVAALPKAAAPMPKPTVRPAMDWTAYLKQRAATWGR